MRNELTGSAMLRVKSISDALTRIQDWLSGFTQASDASVINVA
jgi:hypothetical protein